MSLKVIVVLPVEGVSVWTLLTVNGFASVPFVLVSIFTGAVQFGVLELSLLNVLVIAQALSPFAVSAGIVSDQPLFVGLA